jgi:hypothetical protein
VNDIEREGGKDGECPAMLGGNVQDENGELEMDSETSKSKGAKKNVRRHT